MQQISESRREVSCVRTVKDPAGTSTIFSPDEPLQRARLLAFYLPQFQPTPENDLWWGKGFTEWTNVTRAQRLFRGHIQPRLPADLGFYDLRVPETRAEQAELARAHGIEAFCYWHYWFGGRRILDQVEQALRRSPEPDFPFCLAWANHSWSRSWNGDTRTVLVEQTYSPEDDRKHARYLVEFFADARYFRVHNRPLFAVYAPHWIPEPQRFPDTLRSECSRSGLPNPFLLGINHDTTVFDATQCGYDRTVNLTPKLALLPGVQTSGGQKKRLLRNLTKGVISTSLNIFDYAPTLQKMMEYRNQLPYTTYPSVFTGFDNTARRGKQGTVLLGATPDAFADGLTRALSVVEALPMQERLVFINAWNEWAEGMYLEPDQRYGRAFLEAVRQANSMPTAVG